MKVYELINKLKGTNATLQEIKNWSYMNRVSPCTLQEGLELDCEYPKELDQLREKVCEEVRHDCYKCLEIFFDSEVKL